MSVFELSGYLINLAFKHYIGWSDKHVPILWLVCIGGIYINMRKVNLSKMTYN